MSFIENKYLTADPVEQIRCQQHASRTFVDDQFRLLPKNKFLFHVAFNINWPALSAKNVNIKVLKTLKEEVNLLVKSADLPGYTVSSEVLNQYNRKKVVQYQHKYNDVNIVFHDDNMGLINQVWQAYYRYHYADPSIATAKGAYSKNATKASSAITSPYGYNGRIAPFFNYITIYQMARHEYVSYRLVNPLIVGWMGNKLEYSQNIAHNFDMKIAYEAVHYDTGFVDSGQMEGFGAVHYDWVPSPLTTEYPRNLSTSPTFSRSPGFSASTDNVAATNVVKTTATNPVNPTLYQNVATNTSGVNVPQTGSAATTVATQTTTATTVTPTTTTTGKSPGYTAVI
jgi:hypothetical protein